MFRQSSTSHFRASNNSARQVPTRAFNYRAPKRSFGGGGGFNRGRGVGRNGNNRNMGDRIDPARFVNKAIITEEVDHFIPVNKFQDFKIDETLKQAIVKKGYVEPTPIQDRAIPHILQNVDVIGIANTGTGKTAAFLIPLIDKVLHNRQEQIMIVVPTRELAIQIDQEFKGFAKDLKMYSVCCVGGMNIFPQIKQLRYLNNFVIGTPGRLKDLIDRRNITLSKFNTIVLDEADRMLDMGFIQDMRAIMAGMPKTRQTLFFSATVCPEIEKLIKEFLKEPVRISVKNRDTAKNVDQDVIKVNVGKNKFDILSDLLKQKEFCKVLVFGRTKHGVERLSKLLSERGFKAESIHGNKNHSGRQRALKSFKENQVQVLVATDVAARGLDIPDVSHVINFDLPATYDDYVHRIGRTGRSNKMGKALTFVD
ncbi:MAG: DEAD/DEAH box helicase [Candidatus Taylorbacteria bacterium]|nr:DEAD/DEAH box helicase [Candidatus Taylorbacteria bacterium]